MTLRYVEAIEVIERALPWQLAGKSWTASGYGPKLETRMMVRLAGDGPNRFRRVYVAIFGNAGTAYVVSRGEKLILRNID